ncbi:hypothetical protein DXG01_015219 [Tephrocybe rancida]|nr:hypothetical protein DXG01_015219 [Tephrocybe rancida]
MEASDVQERVLGKLYKELDYLLQQKEFSWSEQCVYLTPDKITVNTKIHFHKRGPHSIVGKAAALVSLVMGHLYFTPHHALHAQLAGFCNTWKQSNVTHEVEAAIPKDPRALSSMFLLDGVTHEFITCPKCYALYLFIQSDNLDDTTATRCTHKVTPTSSPCDAPLWKEHDLGGGRTKSRLLSQPGMEEEINNYRYTPPSKPGCVDDIVLSQVFEDLLDVDGNPFFPGPPGEVRLVFSLSVDTFNPFHMKTAKQQASSTGVQRPEIDPDTSLTLPNPIDNDESLPGDPNEEEVEEEHDDDELDEEPPPGVPSTLHPAITLPERADIKASQAKQAIGLLMNIDDPQLN